MSSPEMFLSRSTQFTPDEQKLAIELERIIFKMNHSVHPGETLRGATFFNIQKSLLSGTQYSDDFILIVLRKLEKVEFNNKSVTIITKIRDLYFSLL